MKDEKRASIGAIFDMDGTILDSMGVWHDAGARYLATLGIRAEEGLGKVLFAMTLPEAAEYLRNRYKVGKSVDDIVDGINLTVRKFYFFDAALKPGTEDLLEKFRSAGVPMAVATVTNRLCTEAVLERTGIADMFDAVITVDEAGAGKDRPDIYLQAAERLGTEPERTLVFEDALHAVRTANRAGFVTVGVYDEYSSETQDELRRESRFYLEDFNDLSVFTEKVMK